MTPMRYGIIGCGNISGTYFKAGQIFDILKPIACADIDMDKAKGQAKEYGCQACTVEALLANADIDLVINLTIPAVHAEISMAALQAGKHVHTEKPLAINRESGRQVIELALEKGLRISSAPDTFMGAGGQTCRKLIDEGAIGTPVAATAFMMGCGPEGWHPSPEFFYKAGGGPLFDMGPYYIHALVNLLGPIEAVSAMTRASFAERTVGSEPLAGSKIKVEIPTHYSGSLAFKSGPVATMVMSFDIQAHGHPRIEVYGSEGTIQVPDPNTFGGPVRLKRKGDEDWQEVPLTHGYAENSRGIGAADLAYGVKSGRPHRANGDLAFHALDAMCAFVESSDQGKHIRLESTCDQPAPLPAELAPGLLDD